MSVWDESRLGGNPGYRFALGLWDPRHKLASPAWMPPLRERRKIAGLVRYVYAINFTLGQNQVLTERFTVTSDFWWTDTIASITAEDEDLAPDLLGTFTVQLFDTKNQVRYMNLPLPSGSSDFAGRYQRSTFSSPTQDSNISPQQSLIHAPDEWSFPYYQRRIDKVPQGATMLMRVQAPVYANSMQTIQVCLGGYTR